MNHMWDTPNSLAFERIESLAKFADRTTQWNQFAEQGHYWAVWHRILTGQDDSTGVKVRPIQVISHPESFPVEAVFTEAQAVHLYAKAESAETTFESVKQANFHRPGSPFQPVPQDVTISRVVRYESRETVRRACRQCANGQVV